ncbi:tRNA (cytidine(32)/guanosine(34)-2'-O)-methyltransferase [Malassezia yamatoensis]|uniref:tRNA (Cytidine(32)/guanosine(34)-2'-O)-methyltransferase n=1 Tax=Malassezia yamatoensis TaxID=253288 RepID=A0AAJ5YS05_9BASI|nr:tRNA (cytidine(32)/guanosine(34)-2'-O)-methyltransferase [Malassezia yamatoensis]
MGKATKDQRDHFYRQGKQEGYRARSAYKLLQLDEEYGLFGGEPHALAAELRRSQEKLTDLLGPIGTEVFHRLSSTLPRPGSIIDLCAAPGSWSQVLSRTLGVTGALIVAVDLQSMAPVDHVTQVVGDITTETTIQAVHDALFSFQSSSEQKPKADLIVCDGAPDVTGIRSLDEYVQSQLLMAAFSVAIQMLREDGCFIAKVFVRPQTQAARMLLSQLVVDPQVPSTSLSA